MKRIETIDVPQANSLEKVSNLLALVDVGILDTLDLAQRLALVRREVDYYRHAARILGFATYQKGRFTITGAGQAYLQVRTPTERKALLAQAVTSAAVFAQLLSSQKDNDLTKEAVSSFLMQRTGLNRTTANRRADTMIAWLRAIS